MLLVSILNISLRVMMMAEHADLTNTEKKADIPANPDEGSITAAETMAEHADSIANRAGSNSQSSLERQRAVFDIKGDISGRVWW